MHVWYQAVTVSNKVVLAEAILGLLCQHIALASLQSILVYFTLLCCERMLFST